MRKKLTTGIEFPRTIRLHPQAATVREREFSATFACVIPVGYDLITRSTINLRWIIVTIFSIYAGRRRGQWITEPFLSHDLRPNVLCIPFTKGKGCVRGLRGRAGGEGDVIPGSAASQFKPHTLRLIYTRVTSFSPLRSYSCVSTH